MLLWARVDGEGVGGGEMIIIPTRAATHTLKMAFASNRFLNSDNIYLPTLAI